jgi:hypothetical protein
MASTVAVAALAGGCQNDRSSSSSSGADSSGGRVISRTQNQDVTPEGTQVQTRTQVRETPSGERVRETQMRTRETIKPADGSGTSGGSSGTR